MTDTTSESNQSRFKLFYQAHKGLTIFIVSIGTVLLFITYPWFYMGGPINGVVIDSLTGKPIEGVVAVMQVNSSGPNIHGTKHETLYLAESVTDKEGKYHFSFWVSKFRPLWLHIGRSPTIGFYKIGYKKNSIYNARHESGEVGIKGARYMKRSELIGRWSVWVGYKPSQNPVLLKKFENSENEYQALLERSWFHAVWIGYGECGWKNVPQYIIESIKVGMFVKKYESDLDHSTLGTILDKNWFPEWKVAGCRGMKKVFSKYINLRIKGSDHE